MTLFIKKVSVKELSNQWDLPITLVQNITKDDMCYVKARKDGSINWEKTSLYRIDELIVRNDVKILI